MPWPALATSVVGEPASGARTRLLRLVAKSPTKVGSRKDSSEALMNCACGGPISKVPMVRGWRISARSTTTTLPLSRRVTNARLAVAAGVAEGVTDPVADGLPDPQPAASSAVAATSRSHRADLQVIQRKRQPAGLVMHGQPEW